MRFVCLVTAFLAFTQAQKIFVVQEGAPVGTYIGQIDSPGPYLIVPLDGSQESNPEDDFIINSNNGEIRTRKILDRETKEKYLFSAIPLNGESIQVRFYFCDPKIYLFFLQNTIYIYLFILGNYWSSRCQW